MDYKEVLENQIKRLGEVQGKLVQIIVEKDISFTGKTLSIIANTSERIESLVFSLIRLQEKETATGSESSSQSNEKY